MLVSNGTLHVGDDFICGMYSGRVRALLDERGRAVKDAGPAIPVQILGIGGVPMAGDQFVVVEDAMESREIAQRRQRLDREAKSRRTAKGVVSLEVHVATARTKATYRIVSSSRIRGSASSGDSSAISPTRKLVRCLPGAWVQHRDDPCWGARRSHLVGFIAATNAPRCAEREVLTSAVQDIRGGR